MNQNNIELSDYLTVLKRRKVALLLPMLLIFIISIALALGLPPVYRSTATILIEQQEIPQDLVRSTVTSYAAERIQIISQKVMSWENLIRIMKKLNMIDNNASEVDPELVKDMRDNLSVDMLSADIINPKTGRASRATIAFTLSFNSEFPEVAKKVTEEMTSLFLAENLKIRTEKARTTSLFLSKEADRLGEQIGKLETQLAAYKERNVGKLPEHSRMNMSLLERAQREAEEIERTLYSTKDRKMLLEAQLANVEPYTGQSPEVKLKQLMSKYVSAASIYTPEHPDLIRMRKEIEVLKEQTGVDDSTIIVHALTVAKQQLRDAGEKYSTDHPDYKRLQKQVDLLEAKAKSSNKTKQTIEFKPKPDNPTYINLQTQIASIDINLKASMERKARLQERLAEYEQRLTDAPRVEQEGLSITRDYQNAVRKYQEIKQKQLQAEIAEQLEKGSKGERFSVIEPARLPGLPEKPNRIGIFLLGTVLSFAGGFGSAALKEMLDHTVRGSKSLVTLLGAHPLSVIPYKKLTVERKKNNIVKWLLMGIGLLIIFVVSLVLVMNA